MLLAYRTNTKNKIFDDLLLRVFSDKGTAARN